MGFGIWDLGRKQQFVCELFRKQWLCKIWLISCWISVTQWILDCFQHVSGCFCLFWLFQEFWCSGLPGSIVCIWNNHALHILRVWATCGLYTRWNIEKQRDFLFYFAGLCRFLQPVSLFDLIMLQIEFYWTVTHLVRGVWWNINIGQKSSNSCLCVGFSLSMLKPQFNEYFKS